jgi:hypothetical protein
MKPSFLSSLVGTLMLLTAQSVLAQAVTIAQDASLYSEARASSKVVTKLASGTTGEVVGKQGPWLNVKSGNATGWMLSTNVRYGEAEAAASAPASGGGFNPFARRQTTQATNTIGIRGFDKETIGNALGGGAVNNEQLALLDGYKAEKPDGAAYASSQSLQASKVPY